MVHKESKNEKNYYSLKSEQPPIKVKLFFYLKTWLVADFGKFIPEQIVYPLAEASP